MDVGRERRLDQLISEAPDHALLGAIRDALGLRRAFPGDQELRELMREAVYYVDAQRLLDQNERSKAAEARSKPR